MRKLEDIVQIVRYAADKFYNGDDVIGVFLFGSAVASGLDDESDVDICLVYDRPEIRRSREMKELRGARLDVCRYPAYRFIRVFEDKDFRGKRDTWFNASLWLGMMKGCEIIKDQHGSLRRWRDAAMNWIWRDDEVQPLERLYLRNLVAANLFIKEEKAFETIIFLREASTAAACIQLMSRDLVPFWDPRFLYRSITVSHEFERLADIFRNINDLDFIDTSRLRLCLRRLKLFVEKEGDKNIGVSTQFHNSRDAYWRHQHASSLLSARFSAFLLSSVILDKRHVGLLPLEERVLDGSQHMEMISKLKSSARSFHDFYLSLLVLKSWDLSALRDAFNDLCDLIHLGRS